MLLNFASTLLLVWTGLKEKNYLKTKTECSEETVRVKQKSRMQSRKKNE